MSGFKNARMFDRALPRSNKVIKEDHQAAEIEKMLMSVISDDENLNTGQAYAAVELFLRNCEASDVIQKILDNAFAADDLEEAEISARHDYAKISAAWSSARQEEYSSQFEFALDERKKLAVDAQGEVVEQGQADCLNARMKLTASQCLMHANSGDLKPLEVSLEQLLQLRDLALRCGYLKPETAKAMTAAFALDIATEQIKGELDRIAEDDPLLAIEHAYSFEPDVSEAESNILKQRAREISEVALARHMAGLKAQRLQRQMRHRIASLGYIIQRLEGYFSGQELAPGECFQHDPHVRCMNAEIMKAAASRGVGGCASCE